MIDDDVLDDARQGGGELPDRADQGRRSQSRPSSPSGSRPPRRRSSKRPAAFPEVLATSAAAGGGIPELRAAIARLLTNAR